MILEAHPFISGITGQAQRNVVVKSSRQTNRCKEVLAPLMVVMVLIGALVSYLSHYSFPAEGRGPQRQIAPLDGFIKAEDEMSCQGPGYVWGVICVSWLCKPRCFAGVGRPHPSSSPCPSAVGPGCCRCLSIWVLRGSLSVYMDDINEHD